MLERWSAEHMSLSLWFLNKRAGRHDFFGLEVLEVWEERHESAEHMLLVLEVLRRGGRAGSHFCLYWSFEILELETRVCRTHAWSPRHLGRGGRTHSHWIGSGNFCSSVGRRRSAEHICCSSGFLRRAGHGDIIIIFISFSPQGWCGTHEFFVERF